MFLRLSVSHFVHSGGVPGQVPPRPGTPPQDQVHSPGTRYTPWDQVHPPGAVHAGRYGQQAGGTHPTGMYSCYVIIPGRIINMETQNVKFSEWQEDIPVDASVWREAARYNVYSLNIIRIFLEVGTGYVTRIGNVLNSCLNSSLNTTLNYPFSVLNPFLSFRHDLMKRKNFIILFNIMCAWAIITLYKSNFFSILKWIELADELYL